MTTIKHIAKTTLAGLATYAGTDGTGEYAVLRFHATIRTIDRAMAVAAELTEKYGWTIHVLA